MTEVQIHQIAGYVKEIGELKEQLARAAGEIVALRGIAVELAAKCVRGDGACIGCASVSYGEKLIHNPYCPVTRLEAYK